ncbi:YesL family protein [Gracilibacillus kekensis]|uniref:Uncharacterized membrane protein YesL n=1 Tax=Gracilibacillus kekensis TaxID=1027249 RepID=A0A1M7QU80_9BACI|nr:DUF624 domain-containing protein [Gracilibacillus kekensis]SHN35083.1 Uncharacterized membrane protein YesL [Gracilibacillus kekensis]
MEMTGLIGRLLNISQWIVRLIGVNLLWCLFNFPIIYLIINTMFIRTESNSLLMIYTIALLLPFVFYPATTALFGVVRRWVIGDAHAEIMKLYWRYYKENYMRSVLGGLVFTSISFSLFYYFFALGFSSSYIVYFSIPIGIFFVAIIQNFFSLTVHCHLSFLVTLKQSLLLFSMHPFTSILSVLVTIAIFYVSFFVFTFLIPFMIASSIAYIVFGNFYISFSKITSKLKTQTI